MHVMFCLPHASFLHLGELAGDHLTFQQLILHRSPPRVCLQQPQLSWGKPSNMTVSAARVRPLPHSIRTNMAAALQAGLIAFQIAQDCLPW
jgi:hypothetical protein